MTRLRAIAPLLVAAALTGGAVAAVQQAGCDDPGRWVVGPRGYELVGGCLAPGDVVVRDPAPTAPPAGADGTAPARS